MIAFVGSVFSPYYAWTGRDDPENHCALNVALYGRGPRRWTMTERGRAALARDAATLAIGPSAVTWNGDALTVEIDEMAAPLPRRVRGRIRLWPGAIVARSFALDAAGRHRWWPIAPLSRVEVALERPALAWRGTGYLDSNAGDEPLEAAFRSWDWARARRSEGPGETAGLVYDVRRRDGSDSLIALRVDRQGGVSDVAAPPRAPLPRGLWRVERSMRSPPERPPELLATLEDTPFYARSLVRAPFEGRDQTWMHESLSCARFAAPWVRALLPFRMPRRAR